MNVRLFVAVEITEEIRKKLAGLQGELAVVVTRLVYQTVILGVSVFLMVLLRGGRRWHRWLVGGQAVLGGALAVGSGPGGAPGSVGVWAGFNLAVTALLVLASSFWIVGQKLLAARALIRQDEFREQFEHCQFLLNTTTGPRDHLDERRARVPLRKMQAVEPAK